MPTKTPAARWAKWYQLPAPPVSGAGVPLQVGTVDSTQVDGAGTDVNGFNGAISPDRTGRAAAIHYDVAANNRAVEIHARSRRSVDPPNTMVGSQVVLRTSRLNENTGFVSLDPRGCFRNQDGACRWGDYAAAIPDPSNDGVIWGTNMFVGTNGAIDFNRFAPPITGVNPARLYRTLNFAIRPSP